MKQSECRKKTLAKTISFIFFSTMPIFEHDPERSSSCRPIAIILRKLKELKRIGYIMGAKNKYNFVLSVICAVIEITCLFLTKVIICHSEARMLIAIHEDIHIKNFVFSCFTSVFKYSKNCRSLFFYMRIFICICTSLTPSRLCYKFH